LRLPNDGGNVFVTDGAPAQDLRVAWRPGGQLEIAVPAQARSFRKEQNYDGIRVGYSSR
jgi:hypothetical protein